jgi:PilZ domain
MEHPRWEFLVVCSDIAVYKTITGALQRVNAVVDYTSGTATAQAFISRRKIDGIFLDMRLNGAMQLVQSIRQGGSNRFSVIFGCTIGTDDIGGLLGAGVNYVLYKPLLADAVRQALDSATQMIVAERKRYLRYQLTVPVQIGLHRSDQKAVTANISRGGMAVRCQSAYEPGVSIQFAFKLPVGVVSGRGEVAWSNTTEGSMGIKFYLMEDQDKQVLSSWLDKQPLHRA